MQFNPLMFFMATFIGIISAYLASKREKNPYLWFAIGFLFGIFGIFAIFFIGSQKKSPQKAKQQVFHLQGPSDKFWYYIGPSNVQQGPMSRDAILTAWRSGKIDSSTYIWHEDLTDWKPLKESLEVHEG